jgi:hypothetical protein
VHADVVLAPWASVPRRPRARSIWSRLFWPYFALFALGLYGPVLVEGLRAATGSLPRAAVTAAVGWAVGWLFLAALAAGVAGGPWWLRRATTSWVLPSRFGPAVLSRASVSLLLSAASIAVVVGAFVALGFDRSAEGGAMATLGSGALAAGALGVLACSLAMLVQPRRPVPSAMAVLVLTATLVIGVSELVITGATPLLAWAASGRSAPRWVTYAEVALACTAAVLAVACTPAARVERIDARARALGPLAVVLFSRDLRSLRALTQALSGEQARSRPPARARRLGPILNRYRHNLRRAPLRRVYRVSMLIAAVSWGWWLVERGSRIGLVAIVVGAWFLAVEAAEPLGQELDRPQLMTAASIRLRLRHLSVAAVLTGPALLLSAVVLVPALGAAEVARSTLALGPGMVVAAAAGAGHALLRPEVEFRAEWLMAPEVFGTSVLFRESIPLLLTAMGLVPLADHHEWARSTTRAAAAGGRGLLISSIVLALVVAVAWWRTERRAGSRR